MIPLAAFIIGFGLGYFRVAKAGGVLPDRLLRGAVTGLIFFLASLALGLLFEAVLRS